MLTCSTCGRENPDDAAFCMACAAPLAPTPPAREVRKIVTVVFCDVTGSTALGERLDPETLRHVMTRYFDEMRTALERHGGTVEKFIGDAVMAVFGIPQVHEDDALRAVRAAAEMRDGLARLNEELENDHGVGLASRIGVNTGEVVAGTSGQTLATGDALNVAARLEQAAATGEILLGNETYRLVRAAIVAEPIDPLVVKGKADPLQAFRLVSVTTGMAGRMARMASRMVGRERELAALHQAFERAVADSACQSFTILAPAGVGKSRLAEEFLDRVSDATVLRGRCLPYGEGITYFPVLEIVKQAAGLADFDAPDLVESKICAVLQGDDQQDVVCKRVAQLLGVAEVGAPEETFWAIRRMLEAMARQRALVLIFDDVHWGESTFLDLVEHVAAWARDAPILLLCMGRPELLDRRPAWGGGKLNAATVSLEPLTEAEAEELIANLIGAAELSHDLRGKIAIAAEGNPLFVEEMLAMLIDDGELTREGGRWISTTHLSYVSIPPTITALLAARLDQLSVGERSLLERASVVGKEFFLGAVRALTPETERSNIDDDLLALVRKELVRPDRSTLPGEDAFRFRHLLVRDATYDAMPKEVRAELHEAFATWLERVAGDRISEQEEILGYHLERAYNLRSELGPVDQRVRALAASSASRLGAAARRALTRGDASAALNLAERAYGLLPADDRWRPRAVRTLLIALEEAGEIDRRIEVAEEALAYALSTGDRALEWWVRGERASDLMMYSPHDTTIEELREVAATSVRVAEESEEAEDLQRALIGLASAQWAVGDMEEMLATSERALELTFASATMTDPEVVITYVAAGMHLGRSSVSASLARMAELVDAGSDRPLSEATARMFEAIALAFLGRMEAGRRELLDARRVLGDLAHPWIVWFSEANAGRFEHAIGDYAAAEILLREASRGWRDLGVPTNAVLPASMWADSFCWLGRPEEALAVAAEFGELAGPWDLQPRIEFGTVRARAHGGLGRPDEALMVISETEALVRTTGFITLLADTMFAKAEVLRLADRRDEAIAAAREALEIFERKGFAPHQERTRVLLSALE